MTRARTDSASCLQRSAAVRRVGGFTLVEIALVVVIASILLMAGMRLMIARAESAQIDVTRKNLDTIKTALISYLGQNSRLPCPDVNIDGQEDRAAPTNPPPCNAYTGTVPYVTLGLDKTAVLDGWDNYIAYVVSPSSSTPPPPLVVPAWTTAWMYSYSSAVSDPTRQTAIGASAFWPTVSTGAITVNDAFGNKLADPSAAVPNGAVVVLISYGRDGYGAINVSGNPNSAAGAGLDELQNITPVVVAGPPLQIVAVNRDITDQNVNGRGAFDDIVLPLRQNDLVAPLVVSGIFQSSPLQTLNQANDYVVGQIMGGRTLCPGPPTCGAAACVGSYYNLPASGQVTPGTVPINYIQGAVACIAATTPPATGNGIAYTLKSLDGNTRNVTISEAIGILGRTGSFN